MRTRRRTPQELSLDDVDTFLSVARLGSINGAARGLGVTPSQVSKAVVRLERQLGARLLERGARGVVASDEGDRLMAPFVDLLARSRALRHGGQPRELTVIAAAYLTAFFLPRIVEAVPELHVHSVETAPGVSSAYAHLPLFDAVLTTGSERWPESWHAVRVGTVEKALYASPRQARRLGANVTPARLGDELFIGPLYSDRGQAVPGDDGCPLPSRLRRFGHRTQAVSVALVLAMATSQLVFAPEIAARELVRKQKLVEIPVEGWNVREPLLLVCHQERVGARVQRKLLSSLRTALRDR